jgi:hypothetical protein
MKKLFTLATLMALVVCVCGIAGAKTEPEVAKAPSTSAPATTTADSKRNEKLRNDMLKLVADAKAGKLKMPAQQFPQPNNRNNLSTGAKIAIIGGIAGAIIFLILWHTTGPGSD